MTSALWASSRKPLISSNRAHIKAVPRVHLDNVPRIVRAEPVGANGG